MCQGKHNPADGSRLRLNRAAEQYLANVGLQAAIAAPPRPSDMRRSSDATSTDGHRVPPDSVDFVRDDMHPLNIAAAMERTYPHRPEGVRGEPTRPLHVWPLRGASGSGTSSTVADSHGRGSKRSAEGHVHEGKELRWRGKSRQTVKEGMVFFVDGGAMPHVVEKRIFEEGHRDDDDNGMFLLVTPVACADGSRQRAHRRVHRSSLQTLGEGRFARHWEANKQRVGSLERAGLIEGVKACLKPGWKAVTHFHKLIGNELEPAPSELEAYDMLNK